ncbi:MAG: HEAT repeat domain-containing protein [Candidatus Riflebacteria bacterium]
MAFIRETRFFERLLVAAVVVAFTSFAYYFSVADLEEVETRYNNNRIVLVKLLAREITELINRRLDMTPRLQNLLAEEAVAYAVVQQADGAVLARADGGSMPLGVLESIEEAALKTPHLQLLPFLDTSRTVSLIEAAMPMVVGNGRKIVIRIGFYRSAEDERKRQIRFRNTLAFSLIMLALASYWFVRKHHASSLQHSLLGGAAVIILLLFLGARMTVQGWYDRHWRQTYVRHCLYLARMFSPSAVRFLETGEEKDLKETFELVAFDDDFASIAIIKDDQIVYHSDPTQVGTSASGDGNYMESLNDDKPRILRKDDQDMYEAYVPLMKGLQRLGTLRAGLRNSSGYEPLGILRDRLSLLFLTALTLMLFFLHLLSRRISKEISWFIKAMEQVTAGDLRQNIYIERNDEFGQMAHTFNFMIMSMKERDMIGRGLQQYVSRSIVERTLKALSGHEKNGERLFSVSLFVYFSGIDEAIARVEGSRIFAAVQECYNLLRKIGQPSQNVSLQLFPSGVLVLFTFPNKHEGLLKALNVGRLAARDLGRRADMPFSPKITMHAMEMVRGTVIDGAENSSLFGDGFADFRTLSKVQDSDEIIASREVNVLLKDVINFEELEVLSGDQGRFNAFIIRNFKDQADLIDSFKSATTWTRIMILRILKASGDLENAELLYQWFKDEDAEVRYQVLDALEKIKPEKLCDFVVGVIGEEKDERVLSRAIGLLGTIGSEEHIPILTEKLRAADRRVKANAVEALEAIGGKRVYEFLNLLVDEQDNRVKANILIALGKYGDLKVFELLSRMIKDSDSAMRASAAYALGRLGMAQGVEPLINALSDKDPMVRRQVVASLTSLKADLDIEV